MKTYSHSPNISRIHHFLPSVLPSQNYKPHYPFSQLCFTNCTPNQPCLPEPTLLLFNLHTDSIRRLQLYACTSIIRTALNMYIVSIYHGLGASLILAGGKGFAKDSLDDSEREY
jgi:hypothetical protein